MVDPSRKRKAVTRDSVESDEVALSDGSADELEGAFTNGFLEGSEGEEEDGGVLDIAVLLGMPMVLIALEAVIVARGCKRPLSPTVVTATVSSPSPLSETT